MSEQQRGRTSEMEMVASRVCGQQSRLCTTVMDGVKKDIEELTKAMEKFNERWDKFIPPLVTDVAVLKTRWQLFGIVGAIIGVIGTVSGILIAVLK